MQVRRRQFCYLAAGGLGLGAVATWRGARSYTKRSWALGSETSITVWHGDRGEAETAMGAAFAAIDEVEEVMSLYRPHSQLASLNRTGSLRDPHPDLLEVLRYAKSLSIASDGAFDVTVQPLWAARNEDVGSDVDLSVIDSDQLEVTPHQVRFKRPGMQATLNGMAQGFAADRVMAVLAEFGIEHALIDTGEIAAVGNREGEAGEPWRVGVQHPRDSEAYLGLAGLSGRCLATSGDYATPLTADLSEHHLIDPKTGRSPVELSSVSVAAGSGMAADALSTAAFVLGLEKGMALIESTPGADALMVRKDDGQSFASAGFPLIPTA